MTATGVGTLGYQSVVVTDPNHRGVFEDLATLAAAIPVGDDGNYAILLNGASPASFGVWDSTLWIDTVSSTGVLSVNADVGPAVVLTADDIAEGATNLYLTGAERAEIANIPIISTVVQTNVNDIADRLLITTWTSSVAVNLTDIGSSRVITDGERTALNDIAI